MVSEPTIRPEDPPHGRRPEGLDDATVAALSKLTEAVECIERARGRLYDFHQLSGHADLLLGEAADRLDDAGRADVAESLRRDVIGRNVVHGRWTFQIVEEYDDHYWGPIRSRHHEIVDDLASGRRHIHESEMKDGELTAGAPRQRRRPDEGAR